MNEPKFAVGDLVDVRADGYSADAEVITEAQLLKKGRKITQDSVTVKVSVDRYAYYLASGRIFFECVLYPHQKPYGDFTEMMTDLKSGKTVEMPA